MLLNPAQARAQSADADLARGLALFRSGQSEQAEQTLTSAWRAYPTDVRFPLELAGIAYRQKHTNTAKSRLHTALNLDPNNEYGNEFLALLYFHEGNLPAALRYWNRVSKPFIQELKFDPLPRISTLLRERAFAISGGQILTEERFRLTQLNLERLRVFSSSKFDLTLRPDQRFDLTFRSAPRGESAGGWLGRILPFVRALPYQAIAFDRYNIGGRAVTLNTLGRWDPNKRRLYTSLSGPVNENPRLIFRFAGDARDETWVSNLILRKVEAGGELGYAVSSKLTWTSGLWITKRTFRDALANVPMYTPSLSFLLNNAFSYQLIDLPEHRLSIDASARLKAGRVLTGAPSRLMKTEAALSAQWLPQAKGDDLQLRIQAAAGKIIGRAPFDELYMLGMERDSDLWLRGHVATLDGKKGHGPIGADFTLIQNTLTRTIARFSLVRFQAGPFLDFGRTGSSGWLTDTGVQVKIQVLGSLSWTLVYGRSLRDGRGAFYTR